jgi:hypothetical protein
MPSAENAQLQYEAGQTAYAMSALTNSGDATTFTSSATLWSRRSGFAPSVLPNGVVSGGAIAPTASNNEVSVAALTLNLNGTVASVNAGTATITRPATAVSKVCSITINSGGSIAVVAGTDGATTAFSETRAAAGGPPLIPTTSVEIAQVRVISNSAAVITAAQIFVVPGLHLERADSPLFEIDYPNGKVTFAGALPLIHTGAVPKAVHASYAAPIFGSLTQATNFVMPETSHSLTSTPIYGGAIASSSSTLTQGSFTAFLNNGVNDAMVSLKNETLWFKFYPDRYQSPYVLCQGKLGITRSFDPAANIQAACTISAESAGLEVG